MGKKQRLQEAINAVPDFKEDPGTPDLVAVINKQNELLERQTVALEKIAEAFRHGTMTVF